MEKCRKFRIEGRVQGVWFRESTRQQAERLALRGYAVNRPDGTVEVLACGDIAALDALAAWLRDGPPLARVASVTPLAHNEDCPDGFVTG
jgi:acylphosphatase